MHLPSVFSNPSVVVILLLCITFVLTLIILRFTPNKKIKLIGNFFKQVLPHLPKFNPHSDGKNDEV